MRHFLSSIWILPLVLLTGSSMLCGVTSCKTTAKNSTLRDNSRPAKFSELVARLEREVTEFVDAPLGGAKVSNSSSPALSLGDGDAEVLTAEEINALRQKTVDMNQALARALRQYEEHSEQKRKQSEAVSLTLIEVAENLKSSGEGATPADLEKLRAVLALLEAGGNIQQNNPTDKSVWREKFETYFRDREIEKLLPDIQFESSTKAGLGNSYNFSRNCVYYVEFKSKDKNRIDNHVSKALIFTTQGDASERCPSDGRGVYLTNRRFLILANGDVVPDSICDVTDYGKQGWRFSCMDASSKSNSRFKVVGKFEDGMIRGLCTSETDHKCIILLNAQTKTICAFVTTTAVQKRPDRYNELRKECGLQEYSP